MSRILERVRVLVTRGDMRVSLHGYEELSADGISVRDPVLGLDNGIAVEDYPEYAKGPCVLVLERDVESRPIHVLWGIPAGHESPAVLITAYRPDPSRWDETWQRRRS